MQMANINSNNTLLINNLELIIINACYLSNYMRVN